MFNNLRSLLTRNKAPSWTEGTSVVADLDALIEDDVHFKLHGKVHVIKPISSQEFLVFTNNLAKLYEMQEKEKITARELIERYFALVNSICKTVTIEDIENMNQNQIGAMFQLILDSVGGKAQAKAKDILEMEKKTPKITQ